MLDERKMQVLRAIVTDYVASREPVGSKALVERHQLGVSPATVRNDMAVLEEEGYIAQPHTSAGRIPTDKGYRLYVNGITDAQMTELPSGIDRSARAIEAHVNSHVDKSDRAIRSAVDSLVELTGNFGFASFGTHLYMNGMTQLFSQPEFVEGDHVQAIARLIDNIEPWLHEAAPNEPLNVFIGSENPIGKSSGATLIISKFRSPFSDNSYIGVIGPTRQNYRRTMELVRRTGAMLEGML